MILCCGDALIDMLPCKSQSDGLQGFVPHCGGAVFNTAIALGRLDIPTGLFAGLSNDMFGQQLNAALKEAQVETSTVVRSDRPTTLAFVRTQDGHATYSFYDENTAGRMLSETDLPRLTDEVSALYFGGISLACDPCGETFIQLMTREAGSRVLIADPNIRTSFIRDEAAFRRRLDQVLRLVDIVKVSDEDLHWIVPKPLTLLEKAEYLQHKGADIVLVTLGANGAFALLPDGNVASVAGRSVTVVDTVGAGDTFNAGVLASLYERGILSKVGLYGIGTEEMAAALDLGTEVAAIVVSRVGAKPPWKHELER